MKIHSQSFAQRLRALNPDQRKRLAERIEELEDVRPSRSIPSPGGLTAFVVPQKGKIAEPQALKEFLARRLPDYMIPSDFILLDSLPLMPNGKVDREALPKHQHRRFASNPVMVEPVTSLEKQVASIWKEVLGVRRVSMRDNFFELGGESLLAVQLFALIKKRIGADLPLAVLFKSPTLKDLVSKIEGENDGLPDADDRTHKSSYHSEKTIGDQQQVSSPVIQNLWESLVPIRPEGSLLPLFLVHGIGGNVLNYVALIPYLDTSQPVYGLQSRGLDGLIEPFQNVDEMAYHYVQEIRKVQPDGPYLLAGGSMGGAVAFEMARLLKRIGQRILFLGMFDTINPLIQYSGRKRNTAHKIKTLFSSGNNFKTIMQRKFTWFYIKRRDQISRMVAKLYRSMGKPIPQIFRLAYIKHENKKIINHYHPKPYAGPITLFRSVIATDDIPDRGWGDIALDGVDVIQINARHGELIESSELGKALGDYLEKINQHYGDG